MSDLSAALVDVRRAYRLLHAYQQRVNDLFALVTDALGEHKLAFGGWYPLGHAMPPKRGTAFFRDRWAWDMFPGNALGASYTGVAAQGSLVTVHVQAVADTGFHLFKEEGGEPAPASFKPAQECTSELRWSVFLRPSSISEPDARRMLEEKYDDDLATEVFRIHVEGGAIARWYWAIDLAELGDRAAVQAKVIAPMVAALREE